MLKFDKRRNVLVPEEHIYVLQDVEKPQLFRGIFPYHEPPKIAFNFRLVPMNTPDEIWITDTTFRDGQQAMTPFTVKQILDLYKMLHRLGGSKGLIRQSEFFLYSKKDREAVEKCLELGYKYPEVTGWIRAVKEDFQLVKQMGLKETGILTSVSDYHIFLKLKLTRRQAMENYLDIVRAAFDAGIIPRCHFEDITRADFYGFVVPFAQELMRVSKESGIPVKIRLCDTLGYGVNYPGVALPRSVSGIIYGLVRFAGVPSGYLEWHGHNDFNRALVNATTAWLYGCSSANGTLLGIGERCGNTPIEALVIEYIGIRGNTESIDTTVITEIAEYFEREIGYKIPASQPFVGANFNLTRAGIHADGLLKDEEIYSIFDTERVLKRPPKVALTETSGLAGIAYYLNSLLGLPKDERIQKTHPGIKKIKEWMQEQYAGGRIGPISDAEILELASQYLPEYFWRIQQEK